MICRECSKDVPGGALFCPHCGASLDLGEGTNLFSPEEEPSTAEALLGAGRSTGKTPSEEEQWRGTFSPKAMVGSAMLLAILTLAGLVVGGMIGGGAGVMIAAVVALVCWIWWASVLVYRRATVRYRLTTFRFFHEQGLLSRLGNRIEMIDVDDVTVQQGLVGRMLGVGTIVIHSSDRTDPELQLPGIDEVHRVADLLDDSRRAERHRRGLHIEAI